MRKYLIIVSFMFLLTLFGCSEETLNNPTDNLKSYLQHWNNEQYNKMYDFLSDETKSKFQSNEFIDLHKNTYEIIEMGNLKIEFIELSQEEIERAIENKEAIFDVNVSMESIANDINFSEQIKLVLIESSHENDDDENEWLIDWKPSLILPNLTEESTVKVEKTIPKRGEILDRNRMPLAIDDIAFEVGLVPELFINEQDEINKVAQFLKMNSEDIKSFLDADWVEEHHFVPIKTISNDNSDLINELRDIPSVKLNETKARHYPLGEKAAHLTGYIGNITAEELEQLDDAEQYSETDVIGKNGLEKIFEKRLRGENGINIVAEELDGSTHIIAEQPVKNGEVISLTIDINIQEKVYDAYEDYAGTAVVLDPKSGQLLSLTSYPAYNPNDFIYGISQSKWEDLLNDEEQPLFNRFSSTFAPGSALKPITGAIGLNNGSITHEDSIEINGLKWSKDEWDDFEITRVSESSKPVNLEDAIVRSDNIYFAMKALEMGGDSYAQGLREFGFDEKIPFDYPVKKSQISNSNSLNNERLLANTSYGQGEIEATPLHMALLYSAFINNGNVVKPVLELEKASEEIWLNNIIEVDDASKISNYLRKVVTNGTAKIANKEDLEISGKTSTVELKSTKEDKGHLNSWFIGYPTDDEDLLVAMMLEKTDDEGSSIVVKTVADIISDIKNENF